MPVTPEQLFAFLDQLGIRHQTVSHPPLFTVEDGRAWRHKISGLHCKSLFLKNKKGQVWLIVMPGDKRAGLTQLEKRLDAGRLSFGKPELLEKVLGIMPGAVTPFALLNDMARRVTVVLDMDMMQSETVNFHPLRNDASTTLRAADLLIFIKALGYMPIRADCGG